MAIPRAIPRAIPPPTSVAYMLINAIAHSRVSAVTSAALIPVVATMRVRWRTERRACRPAADTPGWSLA
jgi:hypothetical protein